MSDHTYIHYHDSGMHWYRLLYLINIMHVSIWILGVWVIKYTLLTKNSGTIGVCTCILPGEPPGRDRLCKKETHLFGRVSHSQTGIIIPLKPAGGRLVFMMTSVCCSRPMFLTFLSGVFNFYYQLSNVNTRNLIYEEIHH